MFLSSEPCRRAGQQEPCRRYVQAIKHCRCPETRLQPSGVPWKRYSSCRNFGLSKSKNQSMLPRKEIEPGGWAEEDKALVVYSQCFLRRLIAPLDGTPACPKPSTCCPSHRDIVTERNVNTCAQGTMSSSALLTLNTARRSDIDSTTLWLQGERPASACGAASRTQKTRKSSRKRYDGSTGVSAVCARELMCRMKSTAAHVTCTLQKLARSMVHGETHKKKTARRRSAHPVVPASTGPSRRHEGEIRIELSN